MFSTGLYCLELDRAVWTKVDTSVSYPIVALFFHFVPSLAAFGVVILVTHVSFSFVYSPQLTCHTCCKENSRGRSQSS